MSGTTFGISIIVILLVIILFQLVYQGIRQEKRHREILERLKEPGGDL